MSSHGAPIPMTSRASGPLKGEAHVPGDKSISHRSLILGAMTVGETKVTGLLEGQFRHRCSLDHGCYGDIADYCDVYR